ncbi:uncharacterized protein M421DRAFT_256495 [Didymella exigua CBS 183.55]|uniref:NACHT domain-containing protein n=1 Tax=Didymella exigua CBS 183.55 TaxID=1150837 RepID=A0A6A5RX54_9PLEO|nr:uncharacterized protein M421DRAFT_256495 [Didymella exigua CBS 183.55]KAF1933065.1 hypothetical protein M421DRAFT_256495 [Didymella exigua CBS 183.55]
MKDGKLNVPVLIFVDGLDHCENENQTRFVLRTAKSIPSDLPIRFLVSSRGTPSINAELQNPARCVVANLDGPLYRRYDRVPLSRAEEDLIQYFSNEARRAITQLGTLLHRGRGLMSEKKQDSDKRENRDRRRSSDNRHGSEEDPYSADEEDPSSCVVLIRRRPISG